MMRFNRLLPLVAVGLLLVPVAYAYESVTAGGTGVPEGVHIDQGGSSLSEVMFIADVIDQNQPSNPTYMAAFSQGDLAQSFQQTNNNISGAGIFLRESIGSSDNVTIQLWDALPNAGGTMLAEASATGTQGTWCDVFWTAVGITPATEYFIVFTGNTSLGVSGDTANPYPYGCVYANPGYQQFASFDYTFRTYYDDAYTSLDRNTWAAIKSSF